VLRQGVKLVLTQVNDVSSDAKAVESMASLREELQRTRDAIAIINPPNSSDDKIE
jgi:hypothetical protein